MSNENGAQQVAILSGTAVSDPIDMRGKRDMIIHMSAGWDAASIAFLVSQEAAGTFLPLRSAADALLEIDTPAVDTAYKAPDISGARFVQLWSETAGVDVNQTADRALLVDLLE